MRESVVLKRQGGLDLFEQAMMTGEERRFWIEELERIQEAERESMRSQQPEDGGHIPGTIPD